MSDLNTATAEAFDGVEGLRGHGFEVVRCREDHSQSAANNDPSDAVISRGRLYAQDRA